METCAICKYFKRDGVDGICFGGGPPGPKFVTAGTEKDYTVLWPRVVADQPACPAFEQTSEETVN